MRTTVSAQELSAHISQDLEISFGPLPLGLVGLGEVQPYFSFLDEAKYLPKLQREMLPKVLLTTNELVNDLAEYDLDVIQVSQPREMFYTLHNSLSSKRLANSIKPTTIHATANVSEHAFIAAQNVTIGKGVKVEANATILSNVVIGDGSVIRAGAIVGESGFEYKRTSNGILSVLHDGVIEIGQDVEIGGGTHIGQGFSWSQTKIGNGTKIDALVHVAHGSQIGNETLIAAGTVLSGSTRIGSNVWIGPGCTISNGLSIGNNAFIGIGSVVLSDVMDGVRFKSWKKVLS